MARRRKGDKIDGWINVDKPAGMTSSDAVAIVRRTLNAQKAGHGGTLDPLATGMLPIALGEATKTIPWCQDHLKTYSFRIVWGEERDTDDAEGAVTATEPGRPERDEILAVLPRFTGEIEQVPPRYSAIKINGERSYDLARSGEDVQLAARPAYIELLTLLEAEADSARFSCVCGKGTYMRSLARDMARALGTAGHIADLRREAVGPFTEENAILLENSRNPADNAGLEDVLLPVETVLTAIPVLVLGEQEAWKLRNGNALTFIARPDIERLREAGLRSDDGATALAVCGNVLVGLVDVDGVNIRPLRLLHLQ